MTSHVQDDGFREIQLNGKQLFFLFMATTVVSVVIFLCGVLVGRGVRFERSALASAGEGTSATEVTEVTPAAAPATEPAPSAAAPSGAPPAIGGDDFRRVDADPPPEPQADVTPVVAKVEAASKPEPAPKPDAQAPTTGKIDAVAPPPAPVKDLVVQVAAVGTRAEADTMAKKLSGKGYSAYVEKSAGRFRVRVGPFATRRDAEAAADKLRRQEGKDPWITRG